MNKLVLIFLLGFLLFFPFVSPAGERPQRGLFVSVIQDPPVLESRQDIARLIDFAKKAHVGILFVQIYRANMAWFPSQVGDSAPFDNALKKVGQDPFQLLISEAHREGIEVHAWLNMLSLGENTHAPLIKKYGLEILTRNRKPKKTVDDYKIDGQFFLEPGDPRVRAELVQLVEEILNAYPGLDGIQFDYLRYPDLHPAYGHTKTNVERFKKVTGIQTFKDDNRAWQEWKREQVTELLKKLVQKAHAIRPSISVSATGCLPFARAFNEAFQDWPRWVDQGIVDFVTVMNYSTDYKEYKRWIEKSKAVTKNFHKINIGLGSYKASGSLDSFRREYRICQESGAGACVVFHYGSLLQNPSFSSYLLSGKR